MITYKVLSEFPIKDVSELWNKAFEGYIVNASMPLDRFITRVASEGLSLEHSFACYVNGEQAGIVMGGFREVSGKKVAWNGGTAVVPAFRGKGIGKAMIARNLELYAELVVDVAYLEAISTNESAIRLYETMNYELVDRLILLSNEHKLDMTDWSSHSYTVTRGLAIEVGTLLFYTPGEVWQSQLPSLKDGESVTVYDGDEAVGYGLFRRTFDSYGNLAGITLLRCESAPNRLDRESIVKAALREIWQPTRNCKRTVHNIRASNRTLIELLDQLGFNVFMEQVLMVQHLNK
ncbi:GNAT family N-acetyltransferase [Paenibacillus anaericanus]|uniref:GNAT family N-acetyltransferase n=1 Tax=Paenibacillus anaericanus TaxID=170367 RepID=A0A433YE01_9BACL|nr:GNAT family N-acetyltransferase [Paenibacillus anaericanus]RUT48102.1 GNAT family N-acetyltransferase [Paenibacillus anaericanus]